MPQTATQRRRAPAAAKQPPAPAKSATQPVELRIVSVATEAKPESFARKLIASGFIALLTGALGFATATWTGRSQTSVAECQIAKDILVDDQLNPALTDQQRRQVVIEAVNEFGSCINE